MWALSSLSLKLIYTRKISNDDFSPHPIKSGIPLHFPILINLTTMFKAQTLLKSIQKYSFNLNHSFNHHSTRLFSKMGDATPTKHQINLLRGCPNPSLLPISQIQTAANEALSNASVSTPGLLYGPDPGYQPLRQSIASWSSDFYFSTLSTIQPTSQPPTALEADAERICITGGASQNLACVLQVFTDPVYTRVWMVAPCYFLACRIFEDAGLRTRAVGEGDEGVDLVGLEKGLIEEERNIVGKVSLRFHGFRFRIAAQW